MLLLDFLIVHESDNLLPDHQFVGRAQSLSPVCSAEYKPALNCDSIVYLRENAVLLLEKVKKAP